MQRLTITFRKDDGARYLSHLDLMACLEFTVRRARLPVALSEGFNPRPRMSLAAPLPLGHVGEAELLELTLTQALDKDHVLALLRASTPAGIDIVSIEDTPSDRKSAASHLHSVVYRIHLPESIADLPMRVEALLALPSIEVTEDRDGRPRTRDIRPLILALAAQDDRTLSATLCFTDTGTARPEGVVSLLNVPLDGVRYYRERIELM